MFQFLLHFGTTQIVSLGKVNICIHKVIHAAKYSVEILVFRNIFGTRHYCKPGMFQAFFTFVEICKHTNCSYN